jgi:hypothetical protein
MEGTSEVKGKRKETRSPRGDGATVKSSASSSLSVRGAA